MKKTTLKKALSLLLCVLLIAAVATVTSGCNDKKENSSVPSSSDAVKPTVLGKGKTTVYVSVTDTSSKTTKFIVHTDKKTVGEALSEVGILADNDNGLYKTVNGITLDYAKDGKYWSFNINGSFANEGADTTEIKAGESYEFKAK